MQGTMEKMELIGRQKVEDAVFTFVDVETTGLSPRTARVCELAAISFRGGERVATFSELINPGGPIPPEVSRIHGITDEMVKNRPAFAKFAWPLADLLENSVIVAHNADFDLEFLREELKRVGMRLPKRHVVDTVYVARKYWQFKSNRLGNIAAELNIPNEGWHRALADVEMTRKIFERFLAKLRQEGVSTVNDLAEKCGRKTS